MIQKTNYVDKKGIPVFVGDLIKVPHFTAARNRKVFMYKKVMVINDRVFAVEIRNLGEIPTTKCHKCKIEDCGDFEVIDGDSINHPIDGTMVCHWERKSRLAK
jgi:hypothetical protein